MKTRITLVKKSTVEHTCNLCHSNIPAKSSYFKADPMIANSYAICQDCGFDPNTVYMTELDEAREIWSEKRGCVDAMSQLETVLKDIRERYDKYIQPGPTRDACLMWMDVAIENLGNLDTEEKTDEYIYQAYRHLPPKPRFMVDQIAERNNQTIDHITYLLCEEKNPALYKMWHNLVRYAMDYDMELATGGLLGGSFGGEGAFLPLTKI